MEYVRRVTLRCLCEDLVDGWEDVRQQRAFLHLRGVISAASKDSDIAEVLNEVPTTARASHPLVRSFYGAFASSSAGVHRESISGLTNPHWWKQKVSRWRGAATDSAVVGEGEVWLCAGGLRAEGDSRDFYNIFHAEVKKEGGVQRYLPAPEDRRLKAVEEKCARLEAWAAQVRLSTLVCIAEAAAGCPVSLHVPAPSPKAVEDAIAHLTFEVVREGDASEQLIELLITVTDQDHARGNLVQTAVETAQSVVQPVVDEWRSLPLKDEDQILATLVTADTLETANMARESGRIPIHLRESGPRLGVRAHYTHKSGIVSAIVDGEAVAALCGVWFVPTANPEVLPICSSCEDARGRLR